MMNNVDWRDKDEVMEAVSVNGYNLKNASLELRNDAQVVICAVKHSGCALAYADLTGILRGNREVALTAVSQVHPPFFFEYMFFLFYYFFFPISFLDAFMFGSLTGW
jgi:hypothetical protein